MKQVLFIVFSVVMLAACNKPAQPSEQSTTDSIVTDTLLTSTPEEIATRAEEVSQEIDSLENELTNLLNN